jgi:hypothetical protein
MPDQVPLWAKRHTARRDDRALQGGFFVTLSTLAYGRKMTRVPRLKIRYLLIIMIILCPLQQGDSPRDGGC